MNDSASAPTVMRAAYIDRLGPVDHPLWRTPGTGAGPN